MSIYTAEDLARRILRDLTLLAPDENGEAADIDHVLQTMDAEFALLEAKDIRIWNGSEQSVPSEYLTTLSRRIGAVVATGFGQMTTADALVVMNAADLDLRILSMTPATGSTQTAEHF